MDEQEVRSDKFQMVYLTSKKENNTLSLTKLFKVFGVSKSGYYSWKKKYEDIDSKLKKIEIEKLEGEMVRTIISKLGHVPGKRTLSAFLFRDFGINYSVKKCANLMKRMNLVASLPHKDAYKGQATYNHICASNQNYVKRDFYIAPRTVILTDITYLYYGLNRDLFYLCTFKDAYTCEILGFAVSKKMTVDLIKDAYNNMMTNHQKTFKKNTKVYIHSDQGSQYLSTTFKQILSDDNFIQSVSRRGNSQDNAPMESFFARLKTSIMDKLALCIDYNTACTMVSNYLYDYNNKHYQFNLGYLTPREYYIYCTTGIYSLAEYCGIPKEKLADVQKLINVREKEICKRRENAKKYNETSSKDKIDPAKIVDSDMKRVEKEIKGYISEADIALKQANKYEELREKINNARNFILNASSDILDDLSCPSNWVKYDVLSYVNEMDGLF